MVVSLWRVGVWQGTLRDQYCTSGLHFDLDFIDFSPCGNHVLITAS